jgi:amino acid adenylation domain-containing protein
MSAMSDTSNLSESRRALLEKMLRGNLPQSTADVASIPRRTTDGPAPLSFAQEQMWLLSHMIPNTPIYNDCVSLHLPGQLDVAAFERSLNEIIRRHEILRTSFPLVDGQPVQMIHPYSAFQVPVIDLRSLPESEREAEGLRLAREDARQLFDLAQGPLLRFKLIRLKDEEHVLFMTTHHIAGDGVGAYQVLLPELSALYQAFTQGQPSPLPELPIQYADYALWQRQQLQGKVLTDHLAYWKEQLAGAEAVLELPADHPRPLHRTYNGSLQTFALPKGLTDALKNLSRQEGVTLFNTLLAAFNILLYRYSGREDMLLGTVTAGRRQPATQKLIGCFLNPFVLRVDLSGAPGFRALLQRVREVTSAALDHDEMPFEYLVQKLRPERSLEQNPFFQVMMVLEPLLPPLPMGWTMSQMEVTAGTSTFDLALELDDRPEGLIGRFVYSTDLFEAATIQRMLGHWQTLLEGIVTDPDRSIATLPLLTAAEQQQLLVDWNATQAPYPQDTCFHQLFEQQAARTPEAVAVVFAQQHLTYRQLDERANRLAHHLRALGVGPEVLVGLCLERSLDLLVGLLGILKAGGAYVPLDPTYPPERLAFMLEDSQAPVLLTQSALLDSLPAHQAQVVCLDTDWAQIAQQPATTPASGVTSDHLAYVIYTSGSTGKPKGVLVTHRGIPNLAQAQQHAYRTGPESRVLQVASFSFDASVADLLIPLPVGGTLYLASDDERVPGPALTRLLQEEAITLAVMMPSMLATLPASEFPALQTVISAGEACTPALVAQWAPGRRFINAYGPTETTVCATMIECSDSTQTPPIGRPLSNAQAYVLDKYLQPVPIGVPGELCVGGVGLARGYLHRPDLTAEKFIAHPFSAEPGARLYRTGDLVRWRSDGTLEYVGRIDQQVKIRGFRIELGEIETLLTQHPAVREVAVIAREDSPGNKRLVAYIVPTPGQTFTSSALRSFAQERLPYYMVPAVCVVLETLPITPNGKLDRRALPMPEETDGREAEELVAPRTPTEEQLAAIWANLLGLKQIGVTENFFTLGGHSLLAVRVLAQVQERFQVELPLSSLFEAPTISDLALKIVQKQANQVDDELTAQLLAELEQLSDDEAQDMLTAEQQMGREHGVK